MAGILGAIAAVVSVTAIVAVVKLRKARSQALGNLKSDHNSNRSLKMKVDMRSSKENRGDRMKKNANDDNFLTDLPFN